jgi:hypothetical protein
MTTAYPLSWPDHIERSRQRETGKFKTSLPSAIDNVKRSISGFAKDSGKKVENVIISSNVTLGESRPSDPGVAVWFSWEGMQVAIPVDRYASVEANLQAIHHVLEARRTELRHGTLALVKASFRGFIALPAPAGQSKRTWQEVLRLDTGLMASKETIEFAYRALAKKHHPDIAGGSDKAMAELNAARAEALEALRNG